MRLQHTVEIQRAPEAVFEFVASHERMPEWISTLESSRAQDGEDSAAAGGAFVQEHVERGKRVRFEGKVLEARAPERLVLALENEQALLEVSYRLEAAGDGTRLAQTTEVTLRSMVLRMMAGAFEGVVKERMEADFRTLKARLEQTG